MFSFKSAKEVEKSGIKFGDSYVVAYPEDPTKAASDEWTETASGIDAAVAEALKPEPQRTIDAIDASDDLEALTKSTPKRLVIDAAKSLKLKATGTEVSIMETIKGRDKV